MYTCFIIRSIFSPLLSILCLIQEVTTVKLATVLLINFFQLYMSNFSSDYHVTGAYRRRFHRPSYLGASTRGTFATVAGPSAVRGWPNRIARRYVRYTWVWALVMLFIYLHKINIFILWCQYQHLNFPQLVNKKLTYFWLWLVTHINKILVSNTNVGTLKLNFWLVKSVSKIFWHSFKWSLLCFRRRLICIFTTLFKWLLINI